MLTLVGVGNYAKVLLVRRQGTDRIYAMKIVRKPKMNPILGVRKEHAFLEKDILVQPIKCRLSLVTHLSSSYTRLFSKKENYISC